MTAALAKPTIEAAPAAIVLKLRAEARALLWSAGQIGSIPDAVDPLQSFAEESGLVLKIGQDAVQQILADAFLPYRETEWQAQAEDSRRRAVTRGRPALRHVRLQTMRKSEFLCGMPCR